MSAETMRRPWVLVEIHTALTYGVPIVPVQLTSSQYGWKGNVKPNEHPEPDNPPNWPSDEALRSICEGKGLDAWLATLPVHPPELVKSHNAKLREQLRVPKMVKYDPDEDEAVRALFEQRIFKRIAADIESHDHGARPEPVVFEPLDVWQASSGARLGSTSGLKMSVSIDSEDLEKKW